MELPSASQLDTSVLDELPESIRQELQAAYQQIDPSISIAKGEETSKPKIIPTPAGSSSAVHRPGRKASGGSGYSGRGRPRKLVFPLGSSTKIVQRAGPASGGQSLMKAFRKVEALDLVMPSQMDSSVWEELPMSIRRELAREYAKSDSAQGSAKEEKADAGRQVHLPAANAGLPEDVPQVSDTELAAPTLFNRSNLNEVLDLVRKWVDTCANEPLVEDIEEFSNYAVSLVKFRDLASSERVH
ncbi:hypothetical protein FBU59_003995 [Linderina macrospora]|uniref:Uncharacterized protein n=1 Tax=Linderina macrospora TaxID=4868 RepID=A0ACC1J713_9FUNG|nr:hypothetical protein FBU59_003995 [Linderina macrospora]